MIPILTVLGLQFGALLAGAIVTETIFSWPGIGRLTIQAIANRDYYLVQGCILAIGLTYVAVNLLLDGLALLGGEPEDQAELPPERSDGSASQNCRSLGSMT